MNPERKAEWVAALRSGDYKQGKAWLHKLNRQGGEQFCCLGVACELAEKAGAVQTTTARRADTTVTYYGPQVAFLPAEVMQWLGLEGDNPEVLWRGKGQTLVELNDKGVRFSKIAELIEEQL